MMKRTRYEILAGLVLSLALVATAAAQDAGPIVYDVELVVFQQLAPNAAPEDWALEERLAQRGQPISLAEEDVPPEPALPGAAMVSGDRQALPREKFQLNAIAAALQRSRNYRPIAHFGWSQAGSPLNAATPLPLDGLLPSGTLTGSAALARGRFLHLTLDLHYQPDSLGPRYVLRQTRRMRSTERHYFDHPQFGVIALVTPQNAAR